MTKHFALLTILLMPFGCQAQSKLVFTWTNPNTLPACSSSVTASCVSGFSLSETTGPPVLITSTISASASTYTLTPLPPPGAHSYSLVVLGKDENGLPIESPPASASVKIPVTLAAPTALTVVIE